MMNSNESKKERKPEEMSDILTHHPIAIFLLILVVILFVILGGGINAAIILTIILVVSFFLVQYLFGFSIQTFFKNGSPSSPTPKIEVEVNTFPKHKKEGVPEIKWENQVFNIPGNTYTYDDAKALCSAYGAKLATVAQVEGAYRNGAEWCNYGWSDGQMALFPTQQETYDKFQKIPGHEHDCGRPGVNGGFMNNPALKFGVNCYGHKPKPTPEEIQMMKTMSYYPVNEQEQAFQNKVNYWKGKIQNILVSPFNQKSWSRI